MGSLNFAGDGAKDVSSSTPSVEIPASGSRGSKGPIEMAGNGGMDDGGTCDGPPKYNAGIIDTSGSKGSIKFTGNI